MDQEHRHNIVLELFNLKRSIVNRDTKSVQCFEDPLPSTRCRDPDL
jgi:hypothetical protein